MKWSAQSAMMMGFGIALILLLGIGLIAVRDTGRLADISKLVSQNHETLEDTQRLLSILTDSETSVRGYVIAGRREFLEPYEAEDPNFEQTIVELQGEVVDEESKRILTELIPVARARRERFRTAIALRDKGKLETLLQNARIGEGKQLMDKVRSLVALLQQRQKALLAARTEEADHLQSRTRLVVASGSTLAVLFLGLASFLVARDMRGRLAAEQRLRETTTLQRAILNGANHSIISTTTDGIIRTFNSAAERWLQYDADEVIGKYTPMLVHDPEEVRERAEELSRELGRPVEPGIDVFHPGAARGLVDEREWTYVRKDGTRFPVLLSVTALYDAWGEINGYMGIASDVTERKRAQDALKKAEETFRTLLQESSDIVVIVSPTGDIQYISPAVERILGLNARTLVGENVFAYLHPDDLAQALESLTNTSKTPGYAVPLELRLRRTDGTYVPMELLANNLLGDANIQGVVINARDVTGRHEMERLKREFISTVSHELRTPLTSIHGALGLMASGKLGALPEKPQRMLDIAVKNTDRLVRLVNEILDIDRMESGSLKMEMRPLELTELLMQASDVMRSMAESAGVRLESDAKPMAIYADGDRLMQMVTNLLSNAIKFSRPGGTVRLSAAQVGRNLQISVADEGRGIPADKLETIFERFKQVDASDSREKGGSGLGLSICRMIAQQHGGRIWAESTLGKGSVFTVEMPLRSIDVLEMRDGVASA
jgi:PAS domain S-box-containing protein